MVDVFISYSRSNAQQVAQLARMVEAEGYKVWWDADLPPHQSYGDVITAKISAARAAIVVWSASSVQSEWVRAEADMARNQKKLIQTSLDEVMPPLPFNQIQYAPIGDWRGEPDHSGWRKVKASLSELCGAREAAEPVPPQIRPAAPPAYAPQPVPAKASTPWGLIAGIGIGAVGIGAAAAMYLTAQSADDSPRPTEQPSGQEQVASPAQAAHNAVPPPAAVPNAAPPAVSGPAPDLPAPTFNLTATVEDPDGYTNVRAGPSLRAEIVNRVQVGERFATYRQAGTWWRVQLADGSTGFIGRSRIRLPGEETTPVPTATRPTRLSGDTVQLRRVISKQP